MKRIRIVVLAVLAVVLTAGVAGAAANSADLTPRLEKWFHSDHAKIQPLRMHTVITGKLDGALIQQREIWSGTSLVSRRSLLFSRDELGDVFYHGDLDGAIYPDPVLWVSAPLTVGKTWSDSAPLDPTGINPGTVHYVFAVLEEAEITCPAGTFTCQRVYVATIQPDGTTSNCNYWYNPTCGLIRCEMDGVGRFALQKSQFIDGPDVPDVDIDDPLAENDVLGLNFSPNPARANTMIRFDLARNAPVTVEVYDISGRLVRRLVRAEYRTAGPAGVSWDGRDETGRPAASGTYIARVRAGNSVTNARVVLVR